MNKLSAREKRLVLALVPTLLLTLWALFWPEGGAAPVGANLDVPKAIDAAKKRIDDARAIQAALPKQMDAKKALDAQLSALDKRLIGGETVAQAQAQLLQLCRKLARQQGAALELRASDIGPTQMAGDYAEISLNVAFDCQVEGLLNLLADFSAQPELLAWKDVRIASTDNKNKRMSVTMNLYSVIPRKLLPKPAGGAG